MAKRYIGTGEHPPGNKKCLLHTAVLQGIAVFFYSTSFATFLPLFPSCSYFCWRHALVFWRAHFLFVGKWRWLLYSHCCSFCHCRGPPSAWISSRNSDGTEVHSVDAGKKKIWVRGQFVEVTDEVYAAYMRGDRKMRYFEADLKSERPV